jgi:hypothetical protein
MIKRKLWVFGDSYGVHLYEDPKKKTEWFWAYQLAKQLGCSEYINRSGMGVGNEYIQYQINQQSKSIKPEDYVIVISSSMSRQWLIYDSPHLSNFHVGNLQKIIPRETYEAIRMYATHLMFDERNCLQFAAMLGWVHYMTDKHNWNTIVVPGFENKGFPVNHKYNVHGSLFDICYDEFKTSKDEVWFYNDFCKTRDNRAGHIIKNNHYILTEKLVDTLTNGTDLRLDQGFEKNCISKDNVNFLTGQLSEAPRADSGAYASGAKAVTF